MKTCLKVCLNTAGLLSMSLLVLGLSVSGQSASATDQIPPAVVAFFGSGFTVQAPAGASQLELRVVDPNRNPVFSQSNAGGDIHWTLSGSETNGEYRYEAVVVMEVNGQMKQRNSGGGFEVQSGQLIGPPDAAELEAKLLELDNKSND